MQTSPVYFAWADEDETEFSYEHLRWDEQLTEATITHEEGEIPRLTVVMPNPGPEGLLSTSRHAWLAYQDGDEAVPLFFGRIDAIPSGISKEKVTIDFAAVPSDMEFQKRVVAQELRNGEGYDPVFLDLTRRDDPDAALEGYSKAWHIDRVTHEVTVSDIINAEDGVELFEANEIPYESVNVEYGERPTSTVIIDSTVEWAQRATGLIYFPTIGISSYGGDGLLSDQPKVGTSIGGGWAVRESNAFDLTGAGGAFSASWSYSYQNKNKRHSNGDTMSISVSVTEPTHGGLSAILTEKIQTGVIDPFAVDSEGNPSPLNIPASYANTSMTVLLWSISSSLTFQYEADRPRSERLLIKIQSDVQPTAVDARNDAVEVLDVPGSDVGIPLLELTDWIMVRNTVVTVGTIIFPPYPNFPGVRIAQICTTGGLTGDVEPDFDPIEGFTTVDGAAVWTSLGATSPDETPEDWTPETESPLGDIIAPARSGIVITYQDLVKSGLQGFPRKGVEVSKGQVIRARNGTFHQCTTAGTTALRGAPSTWNLPNDVGGNPYITLNLTTPEPAFSATWGTTVVDGTVVWTALGPAVPTGTAFFVCTQAGLSGEIRPPFNETIGAVTVDGTIEWTCFAFGDIPVGGSPGNTPSAHYFPQLRGLRSLEYLICIGRAYLLNKARCVAVSFQVPFLRSLSLSCRKSAYFEHLKLPGGSAVGKITKYTIVMKNDGKFHGTVTMMCAIGEGATVTETTGTPVYASADYVGSDYQRFVGQEILLPELEDITYAPPVPGVVDDGLVFPLTYGQVVLKNEVDGSLGAQTAGISEALGAAAEAAKLSEIQPQSKQQAVNLQQRIAALNEKSVSNALKQYPITRDIQLKPVTGGPYDAVYSLETSLLMVPKQIDFGG